MKLGFAWLLAVVCWLGVLVPAKAQETLDGRYFGVDEAAGAAIEIAPDSEGFSGTFFDAAGNSQSFEADKVNDAAEAVLDMDGRTVLMRMAPLPFGAQVSIVPFDENGQLIIAASRSLGFVREGIRLPEMPADFQEAPRSPDQRIAGNTFLASYQFWEPAGVANGYIALPSRFQTLMKFFPAVQLDVIWKLCLAPQGERALALALRNQDVACPEVIEGIARAQRERRFDAYKVEVEAERSSLQMSVRCADGYIESKEACDAAARRLSEAAVSLRTASMVLQKYR